MERVTFLTQDEVQIVGSWVWDAEAVSCALLLHMMPEDRKSWSAFQKQLLSLGMASLAIDLRGHGESARQGDQELDYRAFTDADHQASKRDLDAAVLWIANQRLSLGVPCLAGASIGANLALRKAAEDASIPALLLLSPGENYHGVATFDAAAKLSPQQSLYVAASHPDDEESFEASKKMVELAPCREKFFVPCVSAGHGTDLFALDPALLAQTSAWLAQHAERNV